MEHGAAARLSDRVANMVLGTAPVEPSYSSRMKFDNLPSGLVKSGNGNAFLRFLGSSSRVIPSLRGQALSAAKDLSDCPRRDPLLRSGQQAPYLPPEQLASGRVAATVATTFVAFCISGRWWKLLSKFGPHDQSTDAHT